MIPGSGDPVGLRSSDPVSLSASKEGVVVEADPAVVVEADPAAHGEYGSPFGTTAKEGQSKLDSYRSKQ